MNDDLPSDKEQPADYIPAARAEAMHERIASLKRKVAILEKELHVWHTSFPYYSYHPKQELLKYNPPYNALDAYAEMGDA